MGDAADDIFDKMIRLDFIDYEEPPEKYYWVDSSGETIHMDDMSNYYIGNCMVKCRLNNDMNKYNEFLQIIKERVVG